MTMPEEDIPGVVFELENSSERFSDKTKKKWALITLKAEINKEEVWQAVQEQLRKGFKVHGVEDFKTEIINAMRAENQRMQQQIKELHREVAELQEDKTMLQILTMLEGKREG